MTTSHATATEANSAQNASPAELAKFAAHAHHWWDPQGPLHTLHAINPLRLGWIQKVSQGLQGKTVLDIGCGGGLLSEAIAQAGATSVMGIDLAHKSIKVAQLHALEAGLNNVQFKTVAAEDMAQQQPASFDVVTCMEMLEHVPDPLSIVKACAELVRPGGWVFLSTINQSPKAFFQAVLAAEYIMGMVPKGTHDYAKFIQPTVLAAMCREAGLDVQEFTGLTYNPLTRRYKLTPSVGVNYFLAARKPA